ncbi:DUF1453 family protein [Peterkaempfera bronchialis]|uniref:DUF1453 family protein n=1 Tax=Peterkaempfera bronchialis TaxID=2126346 RepID=A0A345T1A7_9ACTN|nr:DUF1453 family protein [Peterkaempfera bronchialis]AXI79762.1 DUF1453 family protein [Peterkaempfera bronchialis]
MNGIPDALIMVAVVVLVLVRQLRARPVATGRRVWLLPLILAVVALRDPHLIDPDHRSAAVVLLAVTVLLELATGCASGWTMRIWREADGTAWTKGTPAAAATWVGMVLLRLALAAVGAGLGVHQDGDGLLLAVAVLLLVRGLVISWRARTLEPAYGVPAAR